MKVFLLANKEKPLIKNQGLIIHYLTEKVYTLKKNFTQTLIVHA